MKKKVERRRRARPRSKKQVDIDFDSPEAKKKMSDILLGGLRMKMLPSHFDEVLPDDDELFEEETSGGTKMADEKEKKKPERKMCNVTCGGDKIVLPDDMDGKEAIEWIKRHMEENERTIAISEVVEAFPADGAWALTNALSQKYGWTSLIPTPGFWGSSPPAMIGVPTDAKGGTVQIPWGRIIIPKVDGFIDTSAMIKDGRWIFAINGEIRRKNEPEVKEIADLTRKFIKEQSLYKGKAIKMNFVEADPRKFNIHAECPGFIDCELIKEEELILNDNVRALIEQALLTPIKKTKLCRKHKVPLKRGVLLEGVYGTGKSLAAYIVAKHAEANGWTFIYLNSVAHLQKAIFFAKQYAPAVVFAEDVDRVLAGERTMEMNEILNTIDGIDTKASEIITVLTTNHIEMINPAMLRPGRLDAIISFETPDSKSVERLIRMYGRELIDPDTKFHEACDKLIGQIPAIIRETVERAKLGAIGRQKSEKDPLKVNAADLDVAAESMLHHVKFMQGRKFDPNNTPLGQILTLLGTSLGQALGSAEIAKEIISLRVQAAEAAKSTNGGHAGPTINADRMKSAAPANAG
jgi:transitional endoplasmic reticulum ATPase